MAKETGTVAEQAGIPQLDFATFPNQIFWLAAFLVILFLIVSRIALPRIEEIVEARNKRIQGDLEEAGKLAERADNLAAETAERLAAAKSEAERLAAAARADVRAIQEKAMAELGDVISTKSAEAEARIVGIKERAKENVREIATGAALEVVSLMLPGNDFAEAVGSAVDGELEESGK